MPPQADLSILLKAVDGSWTRIGSDDNRGIVPEGLSLSANEAGPDTCSFTLRRVARLPWPDLLAFNQCEIWVGGVLVWGGRIWEAPLSDADEDVIAVQGRGWQYHLDDDLLVRTYVHTRIGDWRDTRTFPTSVLAFFTSIGQVTSDRGALNLGWAAGSTIAVNKAVSVTMDFGSAAEGPERITLDYETSADLTTIVLYVRAHDLESSEHSVAGGVANYSDAIAGTSFTTLGRSGITSATFGQKRRYVSIMLIYTGAAGDFTDNWWMRFKAIRAYRDTAYESGNASILKASDVVTDVLASGAAPLLDSTTEAITASSFSIPDYAPQGRQTPRALIEAVNAYENNLLGVDARRRMFFRERPTAPTLEVGEWSGSSFQDGSTNSGEGLYNRVIVQATGPDGGPLDVARRSVDGSGPQVFDTGAITNGGFEVDTTGWTAVLGTIARSTAAFQEGAASLLITTHNPSGLFRVSTPATTLVAGNTYQLRIWWRGAAASSQGQITADILHSGTGAVLATTADLSRSLTFAEQRLAFVAPTTGAVNLHLVGYYGGSAIPAFYVDAVRIYSTPPGLVDRQRFTRTAVLAAQSALTEPAAQAIADLWLAERSRPPFKGSLTVSGNGCRRAMGGNIHPSELLLQVGERMRFCHLPDPTTGASAREGTIKSVSYNHDEQSASVELDNERGRLEALLERLAVVTGQIAA